MKKVLIAITLSLFLGFANAEITRNTNLVLTQAELKDLNLAKEFLLSDRLDFLVLSDMNNTDFQVNLTKRLSELGWAISWQDIRNAQGSDQFVKNFYKYGGKHLRLEITDIGNDAFKVFAYQY